MHVNIYYYKLPFNFWSSFILESIVKAIIRSYISILSLSPSFLNLSNNSFTKLDADIKNVLIKS